MKRDFAKTGVEKVKSTNMEAQEYLRKYEN